MTSSVSPPTSLQDSSDLTLNAIREAHERIRPFVHRTPVLSSASLDAMAGARLFFKCENLQKVGAFKARGAHNAVFSLSDEHARAGVVTHSSGNHAAALALAARSRGIPAFIVMPSSAPAVKQLAVARYGAQITLCEPTLQARESTAARIMSETGATLVHPYNDLRVMAGQGTVALELLEDVPGLQYVVCPVGGGGLLSGVSVAAKGVQPGIRVFGAEPEGANDAYRSFKSGERVLTQEPRSIADGLLTLLGDRTFAVIQRHVDDIVTVSEASIVKAMRLVYEILKIVIEPSAAVPLAALLDGQLSARGARVGIVLSGGNVDLTKLPWNDAV
jgi:threonine dehydratase